MACNSHTRGLTLWTRLFHARYGFIPETIVPHEANCLLRVDIRQADMTSASRAGVVGWEGLMSWRASLYLFAMALEIPQ